MKKYLFVYLLLFFSTKLLAQTDFDLVKMFNIHANVYTHEKIWLKNNTFLVPINFNTSTYTLENGTVVSNPNFQSSSVSYKILILQYNEEGQLIDYFTLNSNGYELLRDITLDDNDNIYLTLDVKSGYILDGEQYFLNSNNNLQKHLVLKLVSTKNPDNTTSRIVTWKKKIEGDFGLTTLAISSNDNVYIATKSTQSNIIVDGITYNNPTPHQSLSSLGRMIVAKFNKNGIGLDWITSSTNNTTESFSNPLIYNFTNPILRLDSEENLYLVGTLYGSKTVYGNTTLTNPLNNNKQTLFMVKYNHLGNVLWAKIPTISPNSNRLVPSQFEIDENNNLYLLEQYHPGFYGAQTVNYWGHTYSTDKSISTLIKFDTNGNVIWSKKPNVLNISESCNLEYFRIVENKILVFGYFKGVYDYGDGVIIDTNQDYKWVSLEFNKNNAAIDNYYTLNTSMGINPFNYIGMDSQDRLWFAQKTGTSGNFNYYIGSLNYNLGIGNNIQKLIFFRSTEVALAKKEFETLDLTIYPNPTKDRLNLSGKELLNKNYQIYDMVGKLVQYGIVENNHINVNNLMTATYLLKVYDRNDTRKNKSIKFIKQ